MPGVERTRKKKLSERMVLGLHFAGRPRANRGNWARQVATVRNVRWRFFAISLQFRAIDTVPEDNCMTNPSKEDQKPSANPAGGPRRGQGPLIIALILLSAFALMFYISALSGFSDRLQLSRGATGANKRPGNHPLRFVCPRSVSVSRLTKPATYGVDGSLIPAKPGEVLKREFDVLIPSDSSSRSALLDRLNKLRQETKTVRDVDNPDSLSMAPLEYKVVPGSALNTVMTFLCSAFSCDGDRNLHILPTQSRRNDWEVDSCRVSLARRRTI